MGPSKKDTVAFSYLQTPFGKRAVAGKVVLRLAHKKQKVVGFLMQRNSNGANTTYTIINSVDIKATTLAAA